MTIAAISTASAPGGIGIIRISGTEARAIADKVFRAKSGRPVAEMKGYTAALGAAYTAMGEKLDDVVALVFAAPKSYTGEDVVELSCHGGLYITNRLLQEVLDAGAAPAQAGEFTRRAFLNGKLDLTQAEAVMELIGASGKEAARAAQAGSSGALSRRIEKVRDILKEQAAHLSAWADFPEEDVPEVDSERLEQGLERCEQELNSLLESFDKGRIYKEGMTAVIAGRPNAGKSTLMNLLAGCQRSIVTEYAGTTRDVVEETVLLSGVPLRLADTAGIRNTDDPVESIGVASARERLSTAQLVFAVFDSSTELSCEDLELIEGLRNTYTIAVVNKRDLPQRIDMDKIERAFPYVAYISAASGEGLEDLERQVSALFDTEHFDPSQGTLYTQRQRDDVKKALSAIAQAKEALAAGLTLDAVNVCVDQALLALYSLTGQQASEEIINQVFQDFCVGK